MTPYRITSNTFYPGGRRWVPQRVWPAQPIVGALKVKQPYETADAMDAGAVDADANRTGAEEVDAGELMEGIREHLRSSPAAQAGPEVPPSLADPRQDLATLHGASDVLHPELRSHRRFFGGLVLAAKRLLLRLLTPSLELQARHNAATTRLLAHAMLRLERLEKQVESLEELRVAAEEERRPQ